MGAAALMAHVEMLNAMSEIGNVFESKLSKPSYYKTELTPKQRKARNRSKMAKKSRKINRRK